MSSIVTEGGKTLFLFKYTLQELKATKKQLKSN